MARRYHRTYKFFDTEAEAKAFCDTENRNPYIKKNHPATYHQWKSKDGNELKFLAWYSEK